MLGAKQLSAADFKKLIEETNLLESDKPNSKGFVNVSNIEETHEIFTLDVERVMNLGQIIQYLEMQKHDITDAVDKQVQQDKEEEEKQKSMQPKDKQTKKTKK